MVAEEKLRPTTSMSGSALRAEKSVMVLPEPGGPHKTATKDIYNAARKVPEV